MAVRSSRSAQWKKQRLRVLKRDNYICTYCGNPGANEADHIIAKVLGGGDEMDNLTACCRMCNLRKGKRRIGSFSVGTSTPPVFTELLSPKTVSLALEGPFEGQNGPLWS